MSRASAAVFFSRNCIFKFGEATATNRVHTSLLRTLCGASAPAPVPEPPILLQMLTAGFGLSHRLRSRDGRT
jgi:hypothetical protein